MFQERVAPLNGACQAFPTKTGTHNALSGRGSMSYLFERHI